MAASRSGPWREWARLDAPTPQQFAGVFEGEFLGPGPLPALQRLGLGVLGMPGWWGKEFPLGAEVLHGHNVLIRGDQTRPSLAMHARVAPSVKDGRPSMAATYEPDARPPFRWIRDEFRLRADGSMLGMMFVAGRGPGAPFLLHKLR